MPSRSVLKPIAVVVTSAVLVSGFAPAALAAGEAGQVRATVTAEQQDAAYSMLSTLRQSVSAEQVDVLTRKAAEAGDTALVAQLDESKALLTQVSTRDIGFDLVEAFKVAFKILQPFAVAALRFLGPAAGGLLETIGLGLSVVLPQLGDALNDLILWPIAQLLREALPTLADILERIKVDSAAPEEAVSRIADHLKSVAGLSDTAAGALGKALAKV
ncbi:hypothetical protein [Kibdelosporangium phytohabitans]|uniref:Uncharacterized protein n=1 Tax=Kibdelosporangium phytohabitans TaxID=860235 RepID=A0A0N7F2S0_9PSEU|nr:hypothetical protein [Kibdelosporangium phytohabitans]ALG06607.1 hypothetical protein AOZ06_06435 [Kibdelosporangium phytohabitans]MBE1467810.1 hypothetical protein [Kibdelosporangium phytohabitans]